MRKLISISALAAFLLLSLSLQAQMRGGGGGGRGFSGGGRGFSSAPRAGSGFRAAPAFRASPGFRGPVGRSGFVGGRSFGGHGFGGHGFAPSRHGFNSRPFFNSHFRHFGHRPFFVNSCFGVFGCNPFFNSGFFFGAPFYPGYYPFYSGFSDYGSYYPPPAAPAEVGYGNDNSHDVELAMAVQRLSDQVEDLRDEQRSLHQVYPAPAAPGSSLSAVSPAASTVFVMRDGRRMTAKNYAITGQTLWIFDEHAAHKYMLADLDRAATERANSANGVELRLP